MTNLGILNHMVCSLIILSILNDMFVGIGYFSLTDVLCGISLYIDPICILFILPVRLIASLIETKERMVGKSFIRSRIYWAAIYLCLLFIVSSDWKADLRNLRNIAFLRDHSENIGVLWYLFVELFR